MENTSESKKRPGLRRLVLAVTVAALIIVGLNIGKPYRSPFTWSLTLKNPTDYERSSDASDVIIDNGRNRVVISKSDAGDITGIIEGNTDSGQSSIGLAAKTDGSYVYVASLTNKSKTTAIAGESIRKYDMDGNYISTIAKLTWPEDEIHSKPAITDFYLDDGGQLHIALMDGNTVKICSVGDDQEITVDKTVTLPESSVFRCKYSANNDQLAIVTISGDIYTYDGGILHSAYINTGGHLFNCAVIDSDGLIYACDDNNGLLCAIDASGGVKVVTPEVVHTEFLSVFRKDGGGDALVFGDEYNDTFNALDVASGELIHNESANFSVSFIVKYAVITLAYGWLIAMIVTAVVRWAIRRKKNAAAGIEPEESKADQHSPDSAVQFRRVIFMLISAAIVMSAFIAYYTSENRKETVSDIVRSTTFFSGESAMTYGDAVAMIQTPQDYNGVFYEELSAYLDEFYNASVKTDKNEYYFLEKSEGDRLYVVADSTGHYQPGTSFESISHTEEKQRVFNSGEVVEGASSNSWITSNYAVAPVYDSNSNIVGCIEFGMYANLFSQQQIQDALSLIIMALTILLTTIVLMTELDGVRLAARERKKSGGAGGIASIYRPFCFFSFFCSALDTVYLLIIMKSIVAANGFGDNVLLPSTLVTIIGTSAFLSPTVGAMLSERFPIKKLLTITLIVYATVCMGSAFSLAVNNLVLFCIMGFFSFFLQSITFSFQRILSTVVETNEERFRLLSDNNSAYASTSVLGASLGGYIAQYLGYSSIYIVETILAGCAVLICIFGLRDFGVIKSQESQSETRQQKKLGFATTLRYLLTPKGVLPMLIGACLISVVSGYTSYLFPLYAQSLGYNLVSIANVLAIASAISSIFGNGLNDLSRQVGRKRAYIGLFLIMAAVMLFSVLNPAYGWSIVFIIIIRVAVAICGSYEGVYFLEKGKAFGISEPQSINVDVSLSNIMRALRPIIFGWLLLGGYTSASIILAALLAASGLSFMLMTAKKKGASAEDTAA